MFELEPAIRNWKKMLRTYRYLDEGDVAELEAHLRDRIDLLLVMGTPAEEAFEQAVNELGVSPETDRRYLQARTRAGRRSPRLWPELFMAAWLPHP